jgi:hypothetical protein
MKIGHTYESLFKQVVYVNNCKYGNGANILGYVVQVY